MKVLSVGEFKSRFSDALQEVRKGQQIGVSYGRKGDIVAVLVPPGVLSSFSGLRLGLLEGQASFCTKANFKMTDEELFSA